jgi:hypothetical protein
VLKSDKDSYVSDLGSLNFRYSLNRLTSYKSGGSNLPRVKDGTKRLVSTEITVLVCGKGSVEFCNNSALRFPWYM